MRKQYHSRLVKTDTLIWDVHKLVLATVGLPVLRVPINDIAEIDENWWYQDPSALPTPRSFAHHMKLVENTDLSFPIILCAKGRLMDGMHRVAKSLLENRNYILAVRFPVTPAPDFINISLDDLPYPDEQI